jgi:hypothetical protein
MVCVVLVYEQHVEGLLKQTIEMLSNIEVSTHISHRRHHLVV